MVSTTHVYQPCVPYTGPFFSLECGPMWPSLAYDPLHLQLSVETKDSPQEFHTHPYRIHIYKHKHCYQEPGLATPLVHYDINQSVI